MFFLPFTTRGHKKIQNQWNYHLEFKTGLIQKETVEYRGKLVHRPQENPGRDKNIE